MTKTNELLEQWSLVSKQAFNVHHALRVGDEMAVQLNQLQGELNTQRALVQQLEAAAPKPPAQEPYGWAVFYEASKDDEGVEYKPYWHVHIGSDRPLDTYGEDAKFFTVYAAPQPASEPVKVPKCKNEYGLDTPYFARWLNRVIPSLDRYTPAEFAREFGRMAAAADKAAMIDDQFKQASEPVDERAAFEAWAKNDKGGGWTNSHIARNKDGYYKFALLNIQWSVWQARAALRKGVE